MTPILKDARVISHKLLDCPVREPTFKVRAACPEHMPGSVVQLGWKRLSYNSFIKG